MADATSVIGALFAQVDYGTRSCERCGSEFPLNARNKHHRRFCSEACQRSSRPTKTNLEYECRCCGSAFFAKRTDRSGQFCSRECGFRWQQAESKAKQPASYSVFRGKCATCSARFLGKTSRAKFCSKACSNASQLAPKVHRKCVFCGVVRTGTAGLLDECAKCRKKKLRAGQRPLRRHRQRARHYGVDYEVIDPIKVFDRDRWRCQVCGKKTPKRMRGKQKPNSPELDHRVALSQGGGHVWENVQCCCRACNIAKAHIKVVGQLNLFPAPA